MTAEPAAERDWLGWLERLELPALPACDAAARRLVLVAPHPDDEVLIAGGLAARHVAAGGRVLIVAITDGEASHPDDPAWPAHRLAIERARESARGLARLGLGSAEVVRLRLPDGGVDDHRELLVEALGRLLGARDRVVTTWRLDGHPDHEATGAATAEAAARCGAELLEAPVWMWHWSRPGDPRVPWDRLRTHALDSILSRRKMDALAEHATQLASRRHGVGPVLDARIMARAQWPAEHFFVDSASDARHPRG